jgi:hypothetical protein
LVRNRCGQDRERQRGDPCRSELADALHVEASLLTPAFRRRSGSWTG